MKNLKILIVEGNLQSENINFKKAGIQTHTESLKDSIANYHKEVSYEVLNPSSAENFNDIINKLETYDGIVWGGSSLNIYNDTPEIRKQIFFMKECFHKVRNILAICWGMQVAVTVAGGAVKRCERGAHRGIAHDIEINEEGLKHNIYKNKNKIFNTPAFNFDEVVTLPANSILLASNSINKVMGVSFKAGISNIWGIQYHPEISYEKMISLIHFRTERLLNNKAFKDQNEIDNHVKIIEDEIKVSKLDARMRELENWLKFIDLKINI